MPETDYGNEYNPRTQPQEHLQTELRVQDFPIDLLFMFTEIEEDGDQYGLPRVDLRSMSGRTKNGLIVLLLWLKSQANLMANHTEFDVLRMTSKFDKEVAKFMLRSDRTDVQDGTVLHIVNLMRMYHYSKLTRTAGDSREGALSRVYHIKEERLNTYNRPEPYADEEQGVVGSAKRAFSRFRRKG